MKPFSVVLFLFLVACGDSTDSGSDNNNITPSPAIPSALDKTLSLIIQQNSLTGNPAIGRELPDIQTSLIAQLGRDLFFSKSLSGEMDTACASCHHPFLGGADALSLPVGVGAIDPDLLGPGRRHNANHYIDPEANVGPNVPRNSPSIFNIALYDRFMFFDGRVETVEYNESYYVNPEQALANGENQLVRTPDSFYGGPDHNAGLNLTQAQAKFPLVALTEMTGFSSDRGKTKQEIRQKLVERLKGNTSELSTNQWPEKFKQAYQLDTEVDAVTLDRITEALAEYQRSQVLIDTPWKDYVDGDIAAIGEAAKRGAALFYGTKDEGGAACNICHSGDFYTDEKFYALGFPQIGRGKNVDGEDTGRGGVSRNQNELYSFRVPSLLNIALTAPYGHAGTFNHLKDVVAYHVWPEQFNFNLQSLEQFDGLGISYDKQSENTQKALLARQLQLDRGEFQPFNTSLSDENIDDIVAFLTSLTSSCALQDECLAKWIPSSVDPDNTRLIATITNEFDNALSIPSIEKPQDPGVSNSPDLGVVPVRLTQCDKQVEESTIHFPGFIVQTPMKSGLNVGRDFTDEVWHNFYLTLTSIINTGGVAVGDLDDDCDIDLIVNAGNKVPPQVMINSGASFEKTASNYGLAEVDDFSGATLVDLNGDAWLDLFIGNTLSEEPSVYFNNGLGSFIKQGFSGFKTTRSTVGAGFGDVDQDGYMDAFLAHWDSISNPEEQHLWKNNQQGFFQGIAEASGLKGAVGKSDSVFSPNMVDINNDGLIDILSVADFGRTQLFIQNDQGKFDDVTDRSVITDKNGMGTAIGDYDNDGDLDWFITSIYDAEVESGVEAGPEGYWGTDGNRLYQNNTNNGGSGYLFSDVTDKAGVRDGRWGWGACFADFNNDGWLDIFHVNGYGINPLLIRRDLHFVFALLAGAGINAFSNLQGYESKTNFLLLAKQQIEDNPDRMTDVGREGQGYSDIESELQQFFEIGRAVASLETSTSEFKLIPARLFMNQKDGTFKERAFLSGIADPGQGRGISCLDYDRDGDVDVLIVNNTGLPSLYKNKVKGTLYSEDGFLGLKLVGLAPNYEAIGAKVYVTAGGITQMREVRVSNNYISQNPSDLHFGLADFAKVDQVRIVWPAPNAGETVLTDLAVDQFKVIRQSAN